jgi:hypothetical protein
MLVANVPAVTGVQGRLGGSSADAAGAGDKPDFAHGWLPFIRPLSRLAVVRR